ncbi:MAG: RNA polymerase sigma factor SigJ [Archangiaceae bacterium]|nr:RNA polymerase sigma factor SigJ [Archangiaceae bacterium]
MSQTDPAEAFERQRERLLGIAYRILGTRADAEDAVQDTYVRWQAADRGAIADPGAWLTTTCTRRCIDLLQSAHQSRVDYVGAWLPEPLETPDESPPDQAELATSLTTAFLLLLERLTPKERAAYLLHEIFEVPYPEVARSLDMEEPACRKLVSRAKANVDRAKVRYVPPRGRQDELLAAFSAAVVRGDAAGLAAVLSADIQLAVDSGGKVAALREVLQGKEQVVDFVARALRGYWSGAWLEATPLNGLRGFVVRENGGVIATVSFAFDEEDRATRVFIVRNPEKLGGLAASSAGRCVELTDGVEPAIEPPPIKR